MVTLIFSDSDKGILVSYRTDMVVTRERLKGTDALKTPDNFTVMSIEDLSWKFSRVGSIVERNAIA